MAVAIQGREQQAKHMASTHKSLDPKPNALAKPEIARMVERIVARFGPERVILFGSHARGMQTRDSDVDLLVIMPVLGSRREKALEIAVALHDISVPKDIVVTTPEDFAWRKNVVGTIEWPADRKGKVLYAKP